MKVLGEHSYNSQYKMDSDNREQILLLDNLLEKINKSAQAFSGDETLFSAYRRCIISIKNLLLLLQEQNICAYCHNEMSDTKNDKKFTMKCFFCHAALK